MSKIAVTTVFETGTGTIYCAGFVNGKYIQILGSGNLTKKDLKTLLVDKYNKKYGLEEYYDKENDREFC